MSYITDIHTSLQVSMQAVDEMDIDIPVLSCWSMFFFYHLLVFLYHLLEKVFILLDRICNSWFERWVRGNSSHHLLKQFKCFHIQVLKKANVQLLFQDICQQVMNPSAAVVKLAFDESRHRPHHQDICLREDVFNA